MRILLSNDDGYFAPGLERLAAALAPLAAEKRRAMQLAGMAGPATDVSGIAELRAPFDGVVLEAAAQPGQRLTQPQDGQASTGA